MSLLIDTTFKLHGYIESKIGGRAENQDFAGSAETAIGTVVVVCDGMGGMNGGQMASMLAVKTIIDDILNAKEGDDPKEALVNAFLHAQKVIVEESERDSALRGMGTTATAIIISEHSATVAHLGDSRIYQFRNKKKVFRTTDHSAVFQLVVAGTLTEEQARLSANSNIILKALGASGDATPDVATLPYLKGDRFVLCTDGFWGAFPESEFIDLIAKRGNLKKVLAVAAREVDRVGNDAGGGHDNFTAAVIDMECESLLKSPMSKKLKLTLLCILAVLACSICINIVSAIKIRRGSEMLQMVKQYVIAYKDSTATTDSVIVSISKTLGLDKSVGEDKKNVDDGKPEDKKNKKDKSDKTGKE